MKKISLVFIISALFLAVIACGTKSTVVLVPDPDGRTGKLTVTNQGGTQTLDQANQSVQIKNKKTAPGTPAKLSHDEIAAAFSDALAAQPLPPAKFILYFLSDSNLLTQESKKLLPQIIQTILKRKSNDIVISGHTDTVGTKAYNYLLSLDRAKTMFNILVANGAVPDDIRVISHGEGNLLIKTPDDVAEPKNRRVEVVIR
ncbi:MAG: OmpA family protein [Desulfotignum sp.]|jgi:outer membrane protein OmpA-like peptidoglycan-associated protein|nr:OmpA family protein [Desulfotignum sp.]